jgi:hypothetical protein
MAKPASPIIPINLVIRKSLTEKNVPEDKRLFAGKTLTPKMDRQPINASRRDNQNLQPHFSKNSQDQPLSKH